MYPQGYFPFPDCVLDSRRVSEAVFDLRRVGARRGIEKDGGFDRLNMLADALMEGGIG
jgi:hypothetical protein